MKKPFTHDTYYLPVPIRIGAFVKRTGVPRELPEVREALAHSVTQTMTATTSALLSAQFLDDGGDGTAHNHAVNCLADLIEYCRQLRVNFNDALDEAREVADQLAHGQPGE